MRVWNKVVFDIETCQFLDGEWWEYDGPAAECKGASTADAQRQQELQMQQQAFQQQVMQLQSLQSAMSPYITQSIGYDPQQLAAMRSQFLAGNAQQFQNAGQAVRQALLARGAGAGDLPVSGDYTRGISSLMGAAASSQAQGLLGLQQANAAQALQNRFNAAGLLSGNAQTLTGTQGVAGSGASSALQSYIQASNSGLMQQFMGGLGRGLGGGLSSIATGGLSSALSGLGGGGGGGGGFTGDMFNLGGSNLYGGGGSASGMFGTVPG